MPFCSVRFLTQYIVYVMSFPLFRLLKYTIFKSSTVIEGDWSIPFVASEIHAIFKAYLNAKLCIYLLSAIHDHRVGFYCSDLYQINFPRLSLLV